MTVTVVIHHNPDCGTSRNTLEMIRASGEEPVVIEYLNTGWTRPQLLALFAGAGLTPRSALRTSKSPAEELGLTDPEVSDETILEAMLEHPVLVNRPIVVTPRGIRLCRPSEKVLEILENADIGEFTKEDGEKVTSKG
jgi:arsenate reductase